MIPAIFANADIGWLPTIALLIFSLFMFMVVLWILRPNAEQKYQKFSETVLNDLTGE